MELDPRVMERLSKINELLELISRLESSTTDSSIQWDLSTAATRLQNIIPFLRDNRDLIDTSNVLQEVDKVIERARGEIAQAEERLKKAPPGPTPPQPQ